MQSSKWLFFFLLATPFVACDRNDDAVRYFYDETQCADPWAQATGDGIDAVADRVRAYLEERGVEVASVDIISDKGDEAVCLACPCVSGRIIVVTASEEDVDILQGLSFYR